MAQPWLIEEGIPIKYRNKRSLDEQLKNYFLTELRGGMPQPPQLAVRLRDLIIHNNKTLFGRSTDIRLDVLVLHGNGKREKVQSFYTPQTFRFSDVANEQRLIGEDENILIFYGQPLFFVDVSITLSKDKRNSDELSKLLSSNIRAPEIKSAVNSLLSLAVTIPTAGLISAAITASATIGTFAYTILNRITSKSIGFYHASWLQIENFGEGRHPQTKYYNKDNISLSYEIIRVS